MRRPASGPALVRRGFTLLEVLVALALSVVLISAIYAGLHLYWHYSMAGHAEVERALLARAVLRRIELDVRSVVYRAAPAASTSSATASTSGSSTSGSTGSASGSGSGSTSGSSGSSSGSSGGSSSSSSSPTSTASPPVDTYGTSTSGLVGSATQLLMHVSKAAREQDARALALSGNDQTRVSDQTTIAYVVAGMATGTLQQAITGSGLARLEGDRLVLSMADQQGDAGTMTQRTQILAPEVVALTFRYFDGFAPRADWDSSVMLGLPMAIEIEMTLQPMVQSTRLGGVATNSTTSNVYRLVIALPLGKPMDTSTIQLQ